MLKCFGSFEMNYIVYVCYVRRDCRSEPTTRLSKWRGDKMAPLHSWGTEAKSGFPKMALNCLIAGPGDADNK